MPVNELLALAPSPDAAKAAYSGDNPFKKLDEARKSIDNAVSIRNGKVCRIEKILGEGSFGIVYEGTLLSGGNLLPVAIKFVDDLTRLIT